jgi:hypothetical protein
VVLLSLAAVVLAQPHAAQQWTFVTAQGELTRVRYAFEAHTRVRFSPGPATLTALQLTPSLGINLPGDVSLWAAYSRFEQLDDSRPDENRLWQQVLFDRDTDRVRFVMRARVEERFFVGVSGPAVRLRFLVRGSAPLGTKALRLLAQNEVFLHALGAPGVVDGGFDQNRTQASLQFRPVPWLTLEAGYMLQVQRSLALSHNLIVAVTLRLPRWDPFEARDDTPELPVPQG